MKKFIIALAAIMLCGAAFVSCNPVDDATPVKVDPSQLDFTPKAETKTVKITTKGKWTIEKSSYGDWFTVSPVSGKGSGKVDVSVSEVNEVAIFESYFEVVGENGRATVIVSQKDRN